jgi:hypothetical protein
MRVEIRAIRHFLISAAALFLVTGAAQADAVYDDSWDWSGCKGVKSESCWIFSPGPHPLKAVF